jgi:hypothetical protein
MVDLNQRLSRDIRYLIRMEPNVQSCEQTLTLGSGSCRDSAWLLVNILRHLGLAARFVSGYLIQLAQDVKSLDGPSGPEADFTDLHAWTEVYLPGAGWVGMDPTSGLFAGEGHIPLACSPQPQSAAPITGALDPCEVDFSHSMSVRRIREAPRSTRPYPEAVWTAIVELGDRVDRQLAEADVRLTMGGEPTFVSIDDMDGDQWNTGALGEEKQQLAETLLKRLRQAVGPRRTAALRAGEMVPGRIPAPLGPGLLLAPGRPAGVDRRPLDRRCVQRLWLRHCRGQGLHRHPGRHAGGKPALHPRRLRGHPVLPSQGAAAAGQCGSQPTPSWTIPRPGRAWRAPSSAGWGRWWATSCPCSTAPGRAAPGRCGAGTCFCCPAIPRPGCACRWSPCPGSPRRIFPMTIPWTPWPTGGRCPTFTRPAGPAGQTGGAGGRQRAHPAQAVYEPAPAVGESAAWVVRTALCVQPREGRLYVFMPPIASLEGYLELVAAIEATAAKRPACRY